MSKKNYDNKQQNNRFDNKNEQNKNEQNKKQNSFDNKKEENKRRIVETIPLSGQAYMFINQNLLNAIPINNYAKILIFYTKLT